MVGVGRDLCGSPSPNPLPKQGHLQQAAQDLVQAGLEYLQRDTFQGRVVSPHCTAGHSCISLWLTGAEWTLLYAQWDSLCDASWTGHGFPSNPGSFCCGLWVQK